MLKDSESELPSDDMEPQPLSGLNRLELTVGRYAIGGALALPVGILVNIVANRLGADTSVIGIGLLSPSLLGGFYYNRLRNKND